MRLLRLVPHKVSLVLFHAIQRTLRERVFFAHLNTGNVIKSGLFTGMKVLETSSPMYFTSLHLLGSYEPHVQKFIDEHVVDAKRFVDIGCASGYFSVGVPYKYKIPSIGFDICPDQIAYANRLAQLNGLDDITNHTLVDVDKNYDDVFQDGDFCLIDIEGSEVQFIQNTDISKLSGVTLAFELHEVDGLSVADVRNVLIEKLQQTHDFTVSKEVVTIDFNEFDIAPNLTRNDYVYFSNDLRDIHQEWLFFTPKG